MPSGGLAQSLVPDLSTNLKSLAQTVNSLHGNPTISTGVHRDY